VGAIAVKQSVYVLPKSQQAFEDFGWILKEIAEGGGEASVCEARFLEGLTDEQVVSMFQTPGKGNTKKSSRKGTTNEFSRISFGRSDQIEIPAFQVEEQI
jgi:hypothetical protein